MRSRYKVLVVGVFVLCSIVSLSDARPVNAPVIEKGDYKAVFNSRGVANISYKGGSFMSGIGDIRFYGKYPKIIFSPPSFVVMREIKEGEEYTWGASFKEEGCKYSWRASFLPKKIIYELTYSFDKEIKGSVRFYPMLFPGTEENLLGCSYEGVGHNGEKFQGKFPETFPSSPPLLLNMTLGQLGVIEMYSRLGLISLKIDTADEERGPGGFGIVIFVDKRGQEGHIPLSVQLATRDRIFPVGYTNKVRIEISFDEGKSMARAR